MTMHKQREILLALGYYDHRFHRGVARYAREHGWHVTADMAYGGNIPVGWRGDGIIAKIAANDALTRFVASTNVPVVNVGRATTSALPLVLIDEPRLVKLARDHFRERGFEHFAWVGQTPADPADRPALFVRAVGPTCAVLDWQQARGRQHDTWSAQRAWLVDRLKTLPKPLAVFCWDDAVAANVIQACRAAKLATPEQVAVLGVNNDELICDALPVPLSSIDTDMEGRAYLAACLLDRRLRGHRIPARTLVPPKCLVTRKSTDILAVPHVGVARALRFIWDNVHRPITVVEVARVAALSQRGLHKAFTKHLRRTPLQEIHRMRLLHAQRLLRETADKITAIAEMTGFGTAKSMFRAFRRHLSTTPQQYRRSIDKRD